jgi:O-antigen/teichoic acid export membrane protein
MNAGAPAIDETRGRQATALRRLAQRFVQHRNLYAVLKSAAQVFAIRMAGAALTYASMIFLARWLGAVNFGIYAYVFVVAGLLGLALSFGFNSSALRLLPDYLARRKWRRLNGFLTQSFGIIVSFSVLGALAGAGLVFVFRDAIEPHYFVPLLVGLACVPLLTLLNQFESTARAFGWMNLAYVPGYILRPLLLMAFAGGLMAFGGTAEAAGALWAMIAACFVAALAQGIFVFTGARQRVAKVAPAFHTRAWCTISFGFLTIDGLRMLLDNTDVLLIGRLLDPHSVAAYYAAIRTGGLVSFVSFSMVALAVPKFAEIYITGTRRDMQKFVSGVIQMMFWPSLATAVGLAVLGPYVLSLFGADFEMGYPTMLVVLGGLVLRSSTGPVEYLLNMTGHHRDTMRVYVFAAVANVCLNLLLIPTFGIIGAAIATYTAMLSGNVWLYLLVQKRLGVSAFVFAASRRDELVTPAGSTPWRENRFLRAARSSLPPSVRGSASTKRTRA